MPMAGAAADRTGRKKPLLAVAAYVGAAATTGMFFLDGDRYLLGAFLLIVANASLLGVDGALQRLPAADRRARRSATRSPRAAGPSATPRARWSWCSNLVLYHGPRLASGVSESTAVRICLASAGLWWGAFTLVPLRRLRDRRRPARRGRAPSAHGLAAAGGAPCATCAAIRSRCPSCSPT